MRIVRLVSPLLLLLPFAVSAQVRQEGEERADVAPSNWSLGVAGAIRTELYAGEGNHTRAIPFFGYEGERFYFRGISAGYHLVKSDSFVLDGFVSGRLDAMDADDFGRRELARRGIDRDLLEDRDDSVDAGVSASWRGTAGEIQVEVKADIADVSGGYEADVSYRYPMQAGGWLFTPSVGVSALSKDLANYYYGTLDKEVARGVVSYRPGSVTIPHIGLTVAKPFAEKWRFIANVSYQVLPDEISDSPLVAENTDGVGQAFFGISRSF
ncbi:MULTISPECIES: MipA/OmpV family protein [Lysobacter]|uniref:MipA/OmpV family protein n=1 Tax=Lysobacter TaxID=68 RepID=UPI001F406990|nr:MULTISPECIES: MipA/OmpV family protein [Lysobacter]UJB17699.1 MipA/OmpV family protein [Lysobacter capsici]UJQ28579.1 MipA/OmpV family protein [Lysobacter gummosus]